MNHHILNKYLNKAHEEQFDINKELFLSNEVIN